MVQEVDTLETSILEQLTAVNQASRLLVTLNDEEIAKILNELADLAIAETPYILAENEKDLERMDPSNPKYDRLLLNPERLQGIAADLRKVAELPSPLNITLEERSLPNGLELTRVSVPLGVIGIVFESRPNVTFDVFALCLKSGNASVLKGSRDAHYSNIAIVKLIHQVLAKRGLAGVCYLAPSEREALPHILQADKYVNTIIPRGSQGLINFVREHSKVPVIETGAGIVHTYFDKSADLEKGKSIVENAKSRRVSVCNALDTLLIHKDRLSDLPIILQGLGEKHDCKVLADADALAVLQGNYPDQLLEAAQEEDFGTEFLSMKMSVKTIHSLDQALDHIAQYSSKHSEAIVAEDGDTIARFLTEVDAAVVYANTSTAFTDGAQFGMGAEIGISTQKLHARGPMALRELTSYKWLVKGDGHIRPTS
ncbi:MAG: glutamate-5-semialdehyde dehydrogenase [Saprospiraceae bacterium]|nr:glutamate-5-semialdehyde dehydrogenase [Saprospiraceae bacterium]